MICCRTAGRGCTLEVPCSHGSGLHQAATASIILRLQPGSSRNPVIALTAALERLRGALSQAWSGAVQAAERLQAARARTGPGAGTGTAARSRTPRMLVGRAAAGNQLPPRAPPVPPGSSLEVPQAAAASTRAGPAKPNGSGPGRIMFVRLASIEGVMDMPLSQRVRAVRLFSDWLQLQVARHAQCYLQLCNA